MLRLTLIAALFPVAVMAQENETSWANGSSYIRLQPTDAPGAVAEVEFKNEAVHTDKIETFPLSLGGFTVNVEAIVGRGNTPDDMMVTPPEGYIAVPPVVSVPEGETRTITIYSATGAGV